MIRNISLILCAFVSCFLSQSANALLSRSAASSERLTVHGLYTTSDGSCQSGWVKAFLNSSPSQVDFVSAPTLGSGIFSNPINCIMMVIQNSVGATIASGTYLTASNGGSDSVCSGQTFTQQICRGQSTSFPTTVTADAASAGLTLTTSCPVSPAGTEIIPVYLSINSACTGQSTSDSTNPLCMADGGSEPVRFIPPDLGRTANSSSNGLKLTSISTGSGNVYFGFDPDSTIGNNSMDTCSQISPAKMSIHQ